MEIGHAMLDLPGGGKNCSRDRMLVRGQMLGRMWSLQGLSEPCREDKVQERIL
jgi:hypothetical protein